MLGFYRFGFLIGSKIKELTSKCSVSNSVFPYRCYGWRLSDFQAAFRGVVECLQNGCLQISRKLMSEVGLIHTDEPHNHRIMMKTTDYDC